MGESQVRKRIGLEGLGSGSCQMPLPLLFMFLQSYWLAPEQQKERREDETCNADKASHQLCRVDSTAQSEYSIPINKKISIFPQSGFNIERLNAPE
eukprot:3791632-Amphidinium_carterae.1